MTSPPKASSSRHHFQIDPINALLTKNHPQRHLNRASKIRFVKNLLPVLAFFVGSVILGWPHLETWLEDHTLRDAPETLNPPAPLEFNNQLIRPRVRSLDDQGRPYTISAQTAETKVPGQAQLHNPHSELDLGGKTMIVDADQGFFRENENKLIYEGHVQMNMEGYKFTTSSAEIDFNQRLAHGKKPISGHGPWGKIDSQEGFEVSQEGILTFKGRTKLTLYPTS